MDPVTLMVCIYFKNLGEELGLSNPLDIQTWLNELRLEQTTLRQRLFSGWLDPPILPGFYVVAALKCAWGRILPCFTQHFADF